jgi:hypothetical protein
MPDEQPPDLTAALAKQVAETATEEHAHGAMGYRYALFFNACAQATGNLAVAIQLTQTWMWICAQQGKAA